MSECIGIDDVIRDLTTVSSSLKDRAHEMVDRLADIGLADMQGFKNPQGVYDVNDSVVEKKTTKTAGTTILAKGHQVAFIEYGAGDAAINPSDGFDGADFGRGSWSATHKQMYTKLGYWAHKGRKFTFQPANRFAYKAQQSILNSISKESKGLFEV